MSAVSKSQCVLVCQWVFQRVSMSFSQFQSVCLDHMRVRRSILFIRHRLNPLIFSRFPVTFRFKSSSLISNHLFAWNPLNWLGMRKSPTETCKVYPKTTKSSLRWSYHSKINGTTSLIVFFCLFHSGCSLYVNMLPTMRHCVRKVIDQ